MPTQVTLLPHFPHTLSCNLEIILIGLLFCEIVSLDRSQTVVDITFICNLLYLWKI